MKKNGSYLEKRYLPCISTGYHSHSSCISVDKSALTFSNQCFESSFIYSMRIWVLTKSTGCSSKEDSPHPNISLHFLGGWFCLLGYGNPVQYSCLESPMDWGAWQTIVHRVTKSGTLSTAQRITEGSCPATSQGISSDFSTSAHTRPSPLSLCLPIQGYIFLWVLNLMCIVFFL